MDGQASRFRATTTIRCWHAPSGAACVPNASTGGSFCGRRGGVYVRLNRELTCPRRCKSGLSFDRSQLRGSAQSASSANLLQGRFGDQATENNLATIDRAKPLPMPIWGGWKRQACGFSRMALLWFRCPAGRSSLGSDREAHCNVPQGKIKVKKVSIPGSKRLFISSLKGFPPSWFMGLWFYD